MRKTLFAGMMIALCVVSLAGATYSTPSTLIWIPSTDIQASNQTHLGMDVYAPAHGAALTDIGLTWGTGKLEYGVDGLIQSGVQDPIRLNAKAMLKEESRTSPKCVVGLFDWGGAAASNQLYILASKTLPAARFHLGYSFGKKSALGNDSNTILLGIDKTFSGKWWGAIDYQGGKSGFGALNAGVSYTLSPTTSVILGYDWYNNKDLPDTVTVQWDINL